MLLRFNFYLFIFILLIKGTENYSFFSINLRRSKFVEHHWLIDYENSIILNKIKIYKRFKMKTFIFAFIVHISTFGSINSQFQYNNQFQLNPFNIFGQFGYNQQQQQNQQPATQQQTYRPNNQQNFYYPNQPSNQNVYYPQQTRPTVANRNPQNNRPVQTGSDQALRLSERKCNEYLKKAQNSVLVGSLSLIPNIQGIQTDNCDASQGLIIGGENAKAGEFPHMAGKHLNVKFDD